MSSWIGVGMNSLQVTQKALRAMVHDLAVQDLCNEQPLAFKEWNELREGQGHTRIAYSKGAYGIMHELYYMKKDHMFAYV